jgi:hypothetical protein
MAFVFKSKKVSSFKPSLLGHDLGPGAYAKMSGLAQPKNFVPFMSTSERYKMPSNGKRDSLGPGCYATDRSHAMNAHSHKSSLNSKERRFQNQKELTPGPGYYNSN